MQGKCEFPGLSFYSLRAPSVTKCRAQKCPLYLVRRGTYHTVEVCTALQRNVPHCRGMAHSYPHTVAKPTLILLHTRAKLKQAYEPTSVFATTRSITPARPTNVCFCTSSRELFTRNFPPVCPPVAGNSPSRTLPFPSLLKHIFSNRKTPATVFPRTALHAFQKCRDPT